MPLKLNVNTGKIVQRPSMENEIHLMRSQLERQNEILERIANALEGATTLNK